jgi:mono/diheme cytochrome c family protein
MNTTPTTSRKPTRRPATLGVAALLAVSTGAMLGCRDERSDKPPHQFLPDMDDSPKFKNQGQTEFFADGRKMRPRVSGTVAFGESTDAGDQGRTAFLRESPEVYRGIDSSVPPGPKGEVTYVKFIPAAVFEDFARTSGAEGEQAMSAKILRGKELFGIYCAVCHGYQGEGGDPANFTGGVVGRRWAYPVPSFHQDKYRDRDQPTGSDGYLFHVILNGVAGATPADPKKMPGYAGKVTESEAWSIVAYMRVLQAAWREAPAAAASATTGAETKP